MSGYRTILVALDLTEDSETVLRHARRLCGPDCSGLHLVHVAEHPVTGYGNMTGKNHRVSELQVRQQIFPRLKALGENLTTDQLHITFGDAADEINLLAKKLGAEVIVTGSHGERGIRRLLGSTASSIAHHASCDVLTVRISG
jgi:universal stress protein A